MTHKKIIIYIPVFLSFYLMVSQTKPKSNLSMILEMYLKQIEIFNHFSGCGHFLDGTAAFAKQIERESLDNLLEISTKQENDIGKKVHQKVTLENKILTNHWGYEKLKAILLKIKPHLSKKDIIYKVYVLDSESINAFSTLGGNIYVCKGLLEFVDSVDELAFVIGHEIAHIDNQHVLRKHKKLMLLHSIGEATGIKDLINIALEINLFLSAPFDQIDEYDADKYGIDLIKKAGYNAKKALDFFKKLEKSKDKNLVQKLFSTHPFPEDRKKCLMDIIQN